MRRLLVAAMAAAWSARLGSYIFARNLGAEDDPRYAELKRGWGGEAPRQLFLFLQAQALAGWPLAGAALLAAHVPNRTLGVADALGALIFVVGLAGEATADRQIARFRAEPGNRGGICETGLWAYSRHPNYFFEWVCWLGYAFIAADFSGRYRRGDEARVRGRRRRCIGCSRTSPASRRSTRIWRVRGRRLSRPIPIG